MRELISNIFVIFYSVAILWHLYLIAHHGEVLIYEPNIWILGFEIIMFVCFISFALGNIIRVIRSR